MGEEYGFIRNEGSAFATRLGKNYANGSSSFLKHRINPYFYLYTYSYLNNFS